MGFQEKGERVGEGQHAPSLRGLLRDTGAAGVMVFLKERSFSPVSPLLCLSRVTGKVVIERL